MKPRLAAAVLSAFVVGASAAHAEKRPTLCFLLEQLDKDMHAKPEPLAKLLTYEAGSGYVLIEPRPLPFATAPSCTMRKPASTKLFGAAAENAWTYECILALGQGADAKTFTLMQRDELITQVDACLKPKKWKESPMPAGDVQKPGAGSMRWTKNGMEFVVYDARAGAPDNPTYRSVFAARKPK